jgi:DNA-binding HxlR family transcriptional regulator
MMKTKESCNLKGLSICPVYTTLDAIGGRWKPLIVWFLLERTKRFSELQKDIPDVSQKMLTQQLREMERAGLIHRKVYAEVPPRVEYTLTPVGRSLRKVLTEMSSWGEMQQSNPARRVVPMTGTKRVS